MIFIQSHITNFITNKLFGRGQRWLGKVYFHSDEMGTVRKGRNRFICKGGETLDRTFDSYIDESSLSWKSTTQLRVLINNYAAHVPKWSPASLIWGGMIDELRVVPMQKSKRNCIMLGMGYFNWSGGVWNAAPFCLVRRDI